MKLLNPPGVLTGVAQLVLGGLVGPVLGERHLRVVQVEGRRLGTDAGK